MRPAHVTSVAGVALFAAYLLTASVPATGCGQTRARGAPSSRGAAHDVRRVPSSAIAPSARQVPEGDAGNGTERGPEHAKTTKAFYVSATGSPQGDGSRRRPWDLATALAQPPSVRPGATIWVGGGTYKGTFTSRLTGTADSPIVVRAAPGERPVVDENVGDSHDRRWTVYGSYAWYWGIEVMDSSPARSTGLPGSHPPDLPRENSAVFVLGDHLKFINMVCHDLANGLSVWESSVDTEVYGCLTFNNGWNAPDRGHGHGIYTQNEVGTKTIADVISFNNFATGMKAFGVDGPTSGYVFDGVVSFNNGAPAALLSGAPTYREYNLLVGSAHEPSERIRISNCHLYYPVDNDSNNLHLGYRAPDSVDIAVENNTVVRGQRVIYLTGWREVSVTGNTLWLTGGPKSGPKLLEITAPDGVDPKSYHVDDNVYFDTTTPQTYYRAFRIPRATSPPLTFDAWRAATGFDAASTYTRARPAGTRAVVRPNRYEAGRANIVVYNWDGAGKVRVDLSRTGLAVGQRYEIVDVQDLFGAPVVAGVYDGQPVRVPLAGRPVAAPVGMAAAPAHTGPEFFVFLLKPKR